MDWVPSWNYTSDNKNHVMVATFGGEMVGGMYPALSITEYTGEQWNVQLNAGVLTGDLNIDLPEATTGAKVTEELRILVAQEAGNSYNLTLASPAGDNIQLPDGTRASSVQLIPTAGKISEISCANVGGRIIGVLIAEW